jgi:nitrite reductase (NAD(P)H)
LNDADFRILTFEAREAPDGTGGLQLRLPPVDELDGVLGTEKWMVRQAQSEELGLPAAGQAEIIPPGEGVGCGGGCGSNRLDW